MNSNVKKMAFSFLIFSSLNVDNYAAQADVECARMTNDPAGFIDMAVFESWFPKKVYFEPEYAEPYKTNRVRFSTGYEIFNASRYRLAEELIWEMLPNGQTFGRKRQESGFQSTRGVKYICDQTPSEVLSQAEGSEATNTPNASVKVPTTESTESKLEKAKKTCLEIGYTAKTEKFGDCVLKLLD